MLVDTNLHLGIWPFRHLPPLETSRRVDRLQHVGIVQAWAGSFEAVFHRDVSGANERLSRECREHGKDFLRPFGSVNPKLPDWREDARRAHETLELAGLRLYPGYHGYTLTDPEFVSLLELATDRKLPVQVVVKLEDDRTQHPLMKVPAVDVTPLVTAAMQLPGLRLQVLNTSAVLADNVLVPLSRSATVLFDIAMIEGVGGVAKFADRVGLERVAFGSHAPLFHVESAILKLRESEFTEADRSAIQSRNAQAWLGR